MGTGKLMMPYLLIIVLPHKFSITKLYRLANMVNHDILVILLILIGCATLPLCSSNKCITLTALYGTGAVLLGEKIIYSDSYQ